MDQSTVFILNLMVIHKTRGQGSLEMILPMFAASVVGILPGVYVLKIVDGSLLKLAVGAIVLLMSVVMALNFSVTIKRERLASVVAGAIGGFMGGATSMSGPVVAMFLMNQKQDKVAFQADLLSWCSLSAV